MKTDKDETQVFYNSACPVCDWGIKTQQKKCQTPVAWNDLHNDNQLCELLEVDIETARKYLHVVTSDGKQHIGIDAFIVLWRSSPSQAWMAQFFSYPLINRPAKFGYFLFANVLYTWNRLRRHW